MSNLSRSELINAHKDALGTAAKKFDAANNADLDRHLSKALSAFSKLRRRTLVGDITLVSGQSDYAAPADMLSPKVSGWGKGVLQPWERGYAQLPRLSCYDSADGKMIHLEPAPTAAQIHCFGSKYSYFYLALHVIDDDATKTTISEEDRGLLLLLTAIEAMQELVMSGVTAPVSLHNGMGAVSNSMTPTSALEMLTKQIGRYT